MFTSFICLSSFIIYFGWQSFSLPYGRMIHGNLRVVLKTHLWIDSLEFETSDENMFELLLYITSKLNSNLS